MEESTSETRVLFATDPAEDMDLGDSGPSGPVDEPFEEDLPSPSPEVSERDGDVLAETRTNPVLSGETEPEGELSGAFDEFSQDQTPRASGSTPPTGEDLDAPIYCRLRSPWPFGSTEKPHLMTPVTGPIGRIQAELQVESDGVFGRGTEDAIRSWQERNQVPVSGCINARMMRALIPDVPIPDYRRRAFHLTYLFEGTDYHEIEFNWSGGSGTQDGAGITWGPTGMTLASGEIQSILRKAMERDAAGISQAVGQSQFRLLQSVVHMSTRDAMSQIKRNVFDAGRNARSAFAQSFARLAALQGVRDAYDEVSNESVQSKLGQYEAYLRGFENITELDWAMFFDIAVQTGRTSTKVQALRAGVRPGQHSSAQERRQAWGRIISSQVASRWRRNREDRNRAFYSEQALAGNYGLRERIIRL